MENKIAPNSEAGITLSHTVEPRTPAERRLVKRERLQAAQRITEILRDHIPEVIQEQGLKEGE